MFSPRRQLYESARCEAARAGFNINAEDREGLNEKARARSHFLSTTAGAGRALHAAPRGAAALSGAADISQEKYRHITNDLTRRLSSPPPQERFIKAKLKEHRKAKAFSGDAPRDPIGVYNPNRTHVDEGARGPSRPRPRRSSGGRLGGR